MSKLLLVTALALATFSPTLASTFLPVSINPIANWNSSTFYQSPPTGDQVFENVPFTIGQNGANVFFTQDLGMGSGNPVAGTLAVNVDNVIAAHVLIEGTDVRSTFLGRKMGSIVFTYSDASTVVRSLIVGDTIRDWVTAEGTDTFISSTQSSDVSTVWRGVTQAGWGYREAVLDKLSISLHSSATLRSISIYDDSTVLLGDAGPGLYIHAITLETVPEPSSILALLCGVSALGGVAWRKRI